MHQDTVLNFDHIIWGIRYLKGRRCRIVSSTLLTHLIETESGYRKTVAHIDIRKAKTAPQYNLEPVVAHACK